jgi:glycosyltransferase involved in cell wall biosynthesis
MRLLLFLPDLLGGGAQRTMVNLANAFVDRGHAVTLVSPHSDGPARAWVGRGVNCLDLDRARIRFTPGPLRRLIRLVNPDAVLASGIDANIVSWIVCASLGRHRPPLILRETNSHRARGDIGPLRAFLCGMAYRSADHVVALSEGVRHELMELYGLKPDSISTVHNPVAVDLISRRADMARAGAPPVPKKGPLIVGVGRLTRQKGFDRLIGMLARLGRDDVELVLLGEGGDRKRLSELVTEHGLEGRVHMPGFVADPIEWTAHADLFVLPSRWEGFGHVLVEAMAAGVPVIAYDCPHGPRDIIRHGANGLLVQANDEASFVASMRKLLDDRPLAARLAHSAKQDARRFSTERIESMYLDVIGRAVQQRLAVAP